MTVPVQIPFSASTANGVTTVFPYAFKITDADDLEVTVDGDVVTTGFTVTGVGEELGGTVVFSVAPASGKKIIRALKPILTRETDYQQFGDWTAEIVNNDFDRIWLAIQYLQQNDVRSLKLPIDTVTEQVLSEDAATRANKGMKFDADGNLTITTTNPDEYPGSIDDAIAAAATATAAAAAAEEAVSSITFPIAVANGGTGASTASDARGNLGLGTASTKNTGTSAGNVVELDGSAKLPAVDGSNLTNLPVQPEAFVKETISATNITYGATVTISHSLGAIPSGLMLKLRCKTADANYSAGDVIAWAPGGDAYGSNSGCSIVLTSTNIALRFATNGIWLINKTTYAITLATAANWEIIGDIIK